MILFYLVKTLVRKIRQVFLQYKAAVKGTTACFVHSEGKHHCLEKDFGDLERNNIRNSYVKSYNEFISKVNRIKLPGSLKEATLWFVHLETLSLNFSSSFRGVCNPC